MIAEGIRKNSYDGEGIRTYIVGLKDFISIGGTFNMVPDGQSISAGGALSGEGRRKAAVRGNQALRGRFRRAFLLGEEINGAAELAGG
jgi:hypothetical protein